MNPWAGCIKEGIEPRISQKWFFPSHAQVSVSLCSLLLLLSCFCFYCSYCYYHYGYLLAKGFYYSSDYENKPGPYYSKGYENKPRHFNKQKLLSCPMLCFSYLLLTLPSLSPPSDDIISVEGYPTHIISPALLLAFDSPCSSLLTLSLSLSLLSLSFSLSLSLSLLMTL